MDRKQNENAQIVHCRKARTRKLRAADIVLARATSRSDRCRSALVTERLCQHIRLLSPRRESHVYRSIFEQNHQLESRMREIRQSGSEGGGGREASPYP